MENNKKLPLFISKSELALMYLPGLAPHSAVNRFMLWLEKNVELMSELLKLGYRKTQKTVQQRPDKGHFSVSRRTLMSHFTEVVSKVTGTTS